MRSLLYALTVLSLPMRGAWIEIVLALFGIPVYKEDALKDTEPLITEA